MNVEIVISDDFGNTLTSYSIDLTRSSQGNITVFTGKNADFLHFQDLSRDKVLDDTSDDKPILSIADQPAYFNQAANKLTLYFSLEQLREFISALTTYHEIFMGEVSKPFITLTDLFALLSEDRK